MRVMIVGASADRQKFGNKAVRAYLRRGHEVLPVHPSQPQIEGLAAYPDVRSVPGPIDRAAMYIPPHIGRDIIPQLAARGDVRELWFNPGSESPALMDDARRLGLNIIYGCAILDIGENPH